MSNLFLPTPTQARGHIATALTGCTQWCGYRESHLPLADRLVEFATLEWKNKAFRQMTFGLYCPPSAFCQQAKVIRRPLLPCSQERPRERRVASAVSLFWHDQNRSHEKYFVLSQQRPRIRATVVRNAKASLELDRSEHSPQRLDKGLVRSRIRGIC